MRARRTFVLALAGLPAACGFRLRGQQDFAFDTIFLAFPPNSPLAAELARNIRTGSSTQVTQDRAKAQAVLETVGEVREREVLAVNAQGRAREYQLRYRIVIRVHDGKGRDFIGPTELVVHRDIAFNESQVLAREAEEAQLFRDMQSDLVQQMVRRLAAIKLSAATGAGGPGGIHAAQG